MTLNVIEHWPSIQLKTNKYQLPVIYFPNLVQ